MFDIKRNTLFEDNKCIRINFIGIFALRTINLINHNESLFLIEM